MGVQGVSGKPVQGVENQLARTRLDFHNLQISDCRYVDNVFENLPQKLSPSSYVLDEETNILIWGFFLPTTMTASVHLVPSFSENLVACRNTNFKELRALFDITQRSILEQPIEILTVSARMWRFTLG